MTIAHWHILTVQVEQLEQEVAEIRQVLADKQEQENVMLQVIILIKYLMITYLIII